MAVASWFSGVFGSDRCAIKVPRAVQVGVIALIRHRVSVRWQWVSSLALCRPSVGNQSKAVVKTLMMGIDGSGGEGVCGGRWLRCLGFQVGVVGG